MAIVISICQSSYKCLSSIYSYLPEWFYVIVKVVMFIWLFHLNLFVLVCEGEDRQLAVVICIGRSSYMYLSEWLYVFVKVVMFIWMFHLIVFVLVCEGEDRQMAVPHTMQ